MNELKDAMRMLADRAPTTIDDLIDPAIARGRRRRRTVRLARPAAVIAAVAVVVAVVLLASTLRSQQAQTISGQGGPLLVEVSDEAPKPLPTSGKVGPVDLAYRTSCGEQPDAADPCAMWRIRNGSGAQWRLTDVARTSGGDGYREVLLSPAGTRLAYVRPGGAIVVRDLTDGTVHQVDSAPEPEGAGDAIPDGSPRSIAAWSPDGRWLAVHGDPNVRMVDTATWQTVDLPYSGVVIGFPRSGWPVSLYDIDERWNLVTMVARNTRIERQVRLPDRKGFGDATFWGLDGQGLVTPDATRIGAFALVPQGDAAVARLYMLDLKDGRVISTHASREIEDIWMPTLLGWLDANTLLAANNDDDNGRSDYVKTFDIRTGKTTELVKFVGERPNGNSLSLAVDRF